MRKNGFTLVEMLVAIAIVAIIGLILVLIFTNTLRGSNKSQMLSAIKQNGQAVLENIDKTLRNADDLVCPRDDGASKTVIIVKDGVYTRYRIMPSPGDSTVPSACSTNGCIVSDNPVKGIDSITKEEETDDAFKTRVCNSSDSMLSTANILTDTGAKLGILIYSGSFTINKPPGSKGAITVSFELKPGAQALPTIADQIDPITFQTTVQMRNDSSN